MQDSYRIFNQDCELVSQLPKLEYLGSMTLTFLFDHYAVSRTSVLSDMVSPKEDDNTHRTYQAYLLLVAACRPDWDMEKVKRKTFCLITVMQQAFLRYKELFWEMGIDLADPAERRKFHTQILQDILEV